MIDLNIQVCTSNKCSFLVTDKTVTGGNGYVDESNYTKGRFKYSDTISVSVIGMYTIEATKDDPGVLTPDYINDIVMFHEDQATDYTEVKLEQDGWFEINYLVLPTKSWVSNNLELLKTWGDFKFLCTDGKKAFEVTTSSTNINISETPIEFTTVVGSDAYLDLTSHITKHYVSICFLKKCYIALCNKIFNTHFDPCWKNNDSLKDLIFRRDVVWMALNNIEYLVELGRLNEAQRIIELISGCNGICEIVNAKKLNNNGCCCS